MQTRLVKLMGAVVLGMVATATVSTAIAETKLIAEAARQYSIASALFL